MKKMKTRLFLLVLLCTIFFHQVGAENCLSIRFTGKAADAFPLSEATILADVQADSLVGLAASLLADDVERVCGTRPQMGKKSRYTVLMGTLGHSSIIGKLAEQGAIDTDKVEGRWETYGICVVEKPMKGVQRALVIYGSDPRGTAYGAMELSRSMGVSPWYWWADVTPHHHDKIFVEKGEAVFGPPSVRYRGIFINDEDWGLQPWAARNMDTDVKDIGPKTYEKVFELMLRLKANLLWPAMHPCTKAFWYYKENAAMARKYGIVLGSSHCEPLLRNNVDEWKNNFEQEYGRKPGDFNWATNRTDVQQYWSDRVRESKGTDAIYTLGIRGIHDSGMRGYKTVEEKTAATQEVIGWQRQCLEQTLGYCPPQIFCPYKEALTLYRRGLDLPEDVTLMWVDDNFGYVRQLSTPTEQKRKGGGGVYYHFSYWGIPADYLWLGSTPPALTCYELLKAYDMNCREQWVFNVGDIKPLEYEMQYGLDFAWNINSISLENADEYGRKWATEIFGARQADIIHDIKRDYYRLSNAGKPEHLYKLSYLQAEKEQRVSDYQALIDKVNLVSQEITQDRKDAFFQLIEYPVKACAYMNMKFLLGSREAYDSIVALTHRYNKLTAGGKWDGIMDYAPRKLNHFRAPKGPVEQAEETVRCTHILADDYSAIETKGTALKSINGLGESYVAMTIYPLSLTQYDKPENAPYVEYTLPLKAGSNLIEPRFLPDFPLYKGLDLRYGVSIDDSPIEVKNLRCEAESRIWRTRILKNYATLPIEYNSTEEKRVRLRIYFLDPGVALTSISIKQDISKK